jgi:hypothetical protein
MEQGLRRLCRNCQGLFFTGDSMGVCLAGGNHIACSDDYSLIFSEPDDIGQDKLASVR